MDADASNPVMSERARTEREMLDEKSQLLRPAVA